MDSKGIKDSLESLSIIFDKIDALEVRTAIGIVLNLVESLIEEKETDRKTIQELTDEINRLKGEQGKPKIRPQKNNGKDDHSSEEERKGHKKNNSKKTRTEKKGIVKADRTVVCEIDKESLPKDAQSKGYKIVIIQDLKIVTDNVEFKRKVYYSTGESEVYLPNHA